MDGEEKICVRSSKTVLVRSVQTCPPHEKQSISMEGPWRLLYTGLPLQSNERVANTKTISSIPISHRASDLHKYTHGYIGRRL